MRPDAAGPGRRAGRLGRLARRAVPPLLAGAAIGLGQAPFGLVWLALPALALAIRLGLLTETAGRAGRIGWLVGFGYGLSSMAWIVEPFLVDAARDGWLAPFALGLMAAGFGLFWALGFWAARRLAGPGTLAALLALPVCLTLAEMLRSYAFTGLPWGLTAYLWIDTPLYQLAAFSGPHGLTLATLLLAALLGCALAPLRPGRLVAVALAFAVGLGAGAWLQGRPVPDGRARAPMVRLIQPNAPQEQKWDPAMMPVFFERQLRLSAAPPAPSAPAPDLVIWPEAAVPFLLNNPAAPLATITEAAGAPVVLGALRTETGPEGRRAYNSLALLTEGGRIAAVYDKQHLVPFGEYIPFRRLADRIGLAGLAARIGSGYSPGQGERLVALGPGLGLAAPLICYEAIFPHEIRRTGRRPDMLLMITNDGWFGQAQGPWQHFAQARARAVEFALPVLRAANTGISAVIDARGRVVASLELGVAGRVDAPLPAALPASPYWRFGDSPVLGLLIVLAIAAMGLRGRKVIDAVQRRI